MTEARRSVSETAVEALDRARTGQTLTNYPAIFGGFMAKGIPEAEIKARENVPRQHSSTMPAMRQIRVLIIGAKQHAKS